MKIEKERIIVKVSKEHKWSGNIMQKIAEEVVRYAIPIEEVIKNNLSETVLKEIDRQVKNKETVSIQINGKPRLGKSTLGILLGKWIIESLKKYNMKDQKAEFNMKNIARDQNERTKRMREPDLMYDVIVTDESNALEDTGENATIEKAQRDVFSDIQAGRYIHGIWICPEGISDKNCDIKLEVRNRDKGLIHTRVYYNIKSSFYNGLILIGIADFNVNELIKGWLKVEETFMKYLKEKNREDAEIIEKMCKKDFYIEYMCKKYEKMELMNREGILHARDLDYAEMRQEIIRSLRPLAETTLVQIQRLRNNIKSKIESEFRKKKMPLSILGRDIEFERVLGILEMYRSSVELQEGINKVIIKYRKGSISEEMYSKIIRTMSQAKREIELELKTVEEQMDRLIEIKKRYESHLTMDSYEYTKKDKE